MLNDIDFRKVIDTSTMPIMLLDRDLRYVYANDAYVETVATEREKLLGNDVFDVFPEEPKRVAWVRGKFIDVFDGKITRLNAEPYEIELADGTRKILHWLTVQEPVFDENGDVTHMLQRIEDVSDRMELERQKDIISKELDHRVKNLLAVISATALISGQTATSLPQFIEDFGDRLRAMDRTYSRLNDNNWTGMDLRDLVIEELNQFQNPDDGQCQLEGDAIQLSIKSTKDAAMLLHELATNAAKYGCFSVPHGKLSVKWWVEDNSLNVKWVESGMTGIKTPEHTGFGTNLFDMMPNVHVERTYRDEGLSIHIKVPGAIALGQFQFDN